MATAISHKYEVGDESTPTVPPLMRAWTSEEGENGISSAPIVSTPETIQLEQNRVSSSPIPPSSSPPPNTNTTTIPTHSRRGSMRLSANRRASATADEAAEEAAAAEAEGEDKIEPPVPIVKKTLHVNVEAATGTPTAADSLATPGGTRLSIMKGTGGPKTSVNKSKLMALTGEALPTNALDPTGYEQHEEDAKKKEDDSDDVALALMEGLIELDQFGNPVYKSFQSKIRMQFRKKFRGCWKVYDPASPNRQYWSLLVVLALLYGMVEIPIRIGFELETQPWSGPDIFNFLVDLFFLCDVFMNFRTGFYQDDNRLVLDERKIAYRYLKSWFILDILTSVPISHIMQAIGSTSSGLAFVSLPRILRVFRIARLFKILRMLKLMTVMSNWSESSNEKIFSLILKVMKFVVLVFLLSHLSGCIWAFIAMQQKDGDGNFNRLSWPYRYGIYNYYTDTSWSHLYLLSFYWALCTLTTLGYGDIHAGSFYEYAFCIVLTFVGTCLFGYIIGTISSILKHGKETETLYLAKMMELNLYMSYRKISPYLQKKVRKHYEYLWKRQTLYNEAEILQELPNYLKSDLSVYLYKDLIEKVPFLADMGPDCAMLVILKLKPLQFTPGSFVFTKGALGREMFFVSKGTVEVINGSGYIICQLKEGSYVGEYSILSEKPVYRTASIRARTFVDLLSLSKNDFELIWSLYPEIYAKIILRAKEQWQQAISDTQQEGATNAIAAAAAASAVPSSSTTPSITTVAGGKDSTGMNVKDSKSPLKRLPSSTSPATGDTVIRIQKSEDVGSEKKFSVEKQNSLPVPATTVGKDFSGGGDEVPGGVNAPTGRVVGGENADGAGEDDEDGDHQAHNGTTNEYDDDYDELSFIDSLEGMDSENDEDYDVRQDHIDLPDHLLPPPKPRVVGSYVHANGHLPPSAVDQGVNNRAAASGSNAIVAKPTLAADGKLQKVPLANTLHTDGDGATLKDLLKRSSGRQSGQSNHQSLSPMMQSAILSPADERQLARRKTFTEDTRRASMEAAQMAEMNAFIQSTTLSNMPGSAGHKASFLSQSHDGLNRGSLFSSITALPVERVGGGHEKEISTIREDAIEGEEADETTDDTAKGATATSYSGTGTGTVGIGPSNDLDMDVSRVALLKKQHAKRAAQTSNSVHVHFPPGSDRTNSPDRPDSPLTISPYMTPMNGPTPTNHPGESNLGMNVASAAARLEASWSHAAGNQPATDVGFLSLPPAALPAPSGIASDDLHHAHLDSTSPTSLASSPQFWSSLRTLVTHQMAPLQSNYNILLTAHETLQQKQSQTEQLLRSIVAKLKVERAEYAAYRQKHEHSLSSVRKGVDEEKKGPSVPTTSTSSSPTPPIPRLDSLTRAHMVGGGLGGVVGTTTTGVESNHSITQSASTTGGNTNGRKK